MKTCHEHDYQSPTFTNEPCPKCAGRRKFDVGFKPMIYFTLTMVEVAALMECAKCHYDWSCRTIAIPGDGAFLYGASMSDGSFSVASRQLDTLCKIVEMPPPRVQLGDLPQFLHHMMKMANELTPDLKGDLEYERPATRKATA